MRLPRACLAGALSQSVEWRAWRSPGDFLPERGHYVTIEQWQVMRRRIECRSVDHLIARRRAAVEAGEKDEGPGDLHERLEIFLRVCDAVAYANERVVGGVERGGAAAPAGVCYQSRGSDG